MDYERPSAASSSGHSRFVSATSLTPMHSSSLIQADQTGLLRNDDIFWPVLVLRDEMVPDLMRQEHGDDIIPVLLFHKMDILYVERKDIAKPTSSGWLQVVGAAELGDDRDEGLAIACTYAMQDPIQPYSWLQKIRKEYGTCTQPWDAKSRRIGDPKVEISNDVKREREASDGEDFDQAAYQRKNKKRLKSSSWLILDPPNPSDSDYKAKEDDETSDIGGGIAESVEPLYGSAESDKYTKSGSPESAKWGIEEDAELLRLRERVMPNDTWEEILNAFQEKFGQPLHNLVSLRSRYLHHLGPYADIKGDVPKDAHDMARPTALSYLSSLENDGNTPDISTRIGSEVLVESERANVQYAAKQIAGTKWTVEEDAELIRLHELSDDIPWVGILSQFKIKFPLTVRTRKTLRARYANYLQEEAWLKTSKAANREFCDDARAKALSMLVYRAPSSEAGNEEAKNMDSEPHSGQKWTGEEDAHVVWLREYASETSWKRVEALLKRTYPNGHRTASAIGCRYTDYLQPNAWFKGKASNKSVCDDMRARALSLLDHIDTSNYKDKDVAADNGSLYLGHQIKEFEDYSAEDDNDDIPEHPGVQGGSGHMWTAEEDARLIQIREDVLKDASWQQCFKAFKELFPRSSRTVDGMRDRYRRRLAEGAIGKEGTDVEAKECEETRHRAQAFLLEFGNDVSLASLESVKGRIWTAKEDAEVIRLREQVVKEPNWKKIAAMLKRRLPNSGRTQGAVAKRYNALLVAEACGDATVLASECAELRDRALALRVNLSPESEDDEDSDEEGEIEDDCHQTIAEDAEIIRLRERVAFKLQWGGIMQALKEKFPSTEHTPSSIQKRYHSFLEKGAVSGFNSSPGSCKKLRGQALVHLNRAGADSHPRSAPQPKNKPTIISLLSDDEEMEDVDENDEFEEEDEDDSSQTIRDDSDIDMYSEDESDDEIDGEIITIVVGKDQQHFRVPITRALGNDYILQDTIVDDRLGTLVTGARWARIQPHQFRPVYEYFKYGDYRPVLEGDELEDISTDEEHAHEVVRCGLIFSLARELQITELMDLACRKFTVLKKEPLSVLIAVRKVFGQEANGMESDEVMREILVQEVANNYWEYMEKQAKNLHRQAEKTPGFYRQALMRHVANVEHEMGTEQEMGVGH